ncbi:MAG: flagella basal body P-ring formation protein FlgA [Erythrobacter sp.]|uniref:flagella basal body P-ring formation protein FlgA n=1 Tax=Erythrobacter sp. TaxID=1042 RepID=UPI0026333A30|nr:flagella basal body P-ring formation protein FlgA [Erythrobacter sp.]MDJ0979163.1 flagella basal body P-ring formation protein FlgA [Erythrobacter sp.]
MPVSQAPIASRGLRARLASLAPLLALPFSSALLIALPYIALAAGAPGFPVIDPAEIDRAVTAFTGAKVGEIGGARATADPRLRLAACAAPLTTSWHGTTRSAVRVECAKPLGNTGPWRIFVATRPGPRTAAPSMAAPSKAAPAEPVALPVVERGDPITVIVRGRGFTVQQAGEALEKGRIGDWIAVRTARQANPVRARIERPGLAVIPVG